MIEPRFQMVPSDPVLCVQEELDFWLCRFIVKIRRKDGTEYPPNTLLSITSGIQRHMRENGRPETVLLATNNMYVPTFQKAIGFRMKELTSKGVGIHSKRADPVTEMDEHKLWEASTFNLDTGNGLNYAVFFYNCKLFGFREMDKTQETVLHSSKLLMTFSLKMETRVLYKFSRGI